MTETVTPQGLVAVCHQRDVPLARALAAEPRLVVVLVDIRDPGNAGTVLRTADAAGAEPGLFAGDAVDPYNGKCVRASAGSLFHVDLVRAAAPAALVAQLRAAGFSVLATSGRGETDLDHLVDSGSWRRRPRGCSAGRPTVCPPSCSPPPTGASGCRCTGGPRVSTWVRRRRCACTLRQSATFCEGSLHESDDVLYPARRWRAAELTPPLLAPVGCGGPATR